MSDKPQAVNSALNTLLEWRCVENELPEIGVDVLCCKSNGNMFVSSYSGEIKRPYRRATQRPVFNDPTGYYSPDGEFYVTHWMPLPQKPL